MADRIDTTMNGVILATLRTASMGVEGMCKLRIDGEGIQQPASYYRAVERVIGMQEVVSALQVKFPKVLAFQFLQDTLSEAVAKGGK